MYCYPHHQREGKQHFGCEDLEGVELENQGGEGTALHHWEKRVLGVSQGVGGSNNVSYIAVTVYINVLHVHSHHCRCLTHTF